MLPVIFQILGPIIGKAIAAKITAQPVLANATDPSKGLIASKTFYGVVVAILPVLLRMFHIQLMDADVQLVAENIVSIAGAAFAIYGRMKASKSIG